MKKRQEEKQGTRLEVVAMIQMRDDDTLDQDSIKGEVVGCGQILDIF